MMRFRLKRDWSQKAACKWVEREREKSLSFLPLLRDIKPTNTERQTHLSLLSLSTQALFISWTWCACIHTQIKHIIYIVDACIWYVWYTCRACTSMIHNIIEICVVGVPYMCVEWRERRERQARERDVCMDCWYCFHTHMLFSAVKIE